MYFERLQHQQYVFLVGILLWHSIASLARNCCIEGETQEDPNDGISYYVCCGGTLVHKTCETGSYWNSTMQSCKSDAAECRENDIQLDPQDCAAYFLCVMGQFVSQKCAHGTYFDTTIMACVGDTKGNSTTTF
ncbi:uncharacterized protein LOC116804301 isoform X1 [Drosophila mojavensis]|uniref:uncharacterized protein LOC116804301 isoform X1 n=1 Tax=Drosophila mojavensis TaxID=7230 RepID=UPI0013EEC248|nr:uncharacterized protein LOC116804301 isoform X1 [Drosophila mojavensis]